MTYLQLPTEVLAHLSRMSGAQVGIWADAWTWEQQGGKAYRTNAQLAEMLGITVKSVSCAITNLRKAGYLEWTMVNGRQRILKATIPSDVNPPVERKPSRQTSIPSDVNAASRPTYTQHPVERKGCIPSDVNQVEHRVEHRVEQVVEKGDDESFSEFETVQEPEAAPTNPARGARAKRQRVFHDVVLPWETETFKAAWREWLDYKWDQHRFAFKQPRYEQTALHNLQKDSNGNEELAIHIIATSIASGWKGLIANSAKSYKGPRTGSSGYFHSSGKYKHPSEVIKDRDIWG